MHILSDEFSRQATMEEELSIATSLMAPPKKDMVSLGKAQLGFMNLFALPLFQGVADLMPDMQYLVDELETNKMLFEREVDEEQKRGDPALRMLQRDGTFSPRTMSMAVTPDQNQNQNNKASPPPPTLLASVAPAILANRSASEKEFMTRPADPVDKPADVPAVINGEYKEVNGLVTSFEAVADFAASDPFNTHDGRENGNGNTQGHTQGIGHGHHVMRGSDKQRCSETTENSSVPPYSVEWASGATSATTGKMPLSPSTQGTSIVSRDSMDRPVSVPVTTVTAPESITTAPESAKSRTDLKMESQISIDDDHSSNDRDNGTLRPTECQVLKKKPSRFRITSGFHLFRRHKGATNTAVSATDAAG